MYLSYFLPGSLVTYLLVKYLRLQCALRVGVREAGRASDG